MLLAKSHVYSSEFNMFFRNVLNIWGTNTKFFHDEKAFHLSKIFYPTDFEDLCSLFHIHHKILID